MKKSKGMSALPQNSLEKICGVRVRGGARVRVGFSR